MAEARWPLFGRRGWEAELVPREAAAGGVGGVGEAGGRVAGEQLDPGIRAGEGVRGAPGAGGAGGKAAGG